VSELQPEENRESILQRLEPQCGGEGRNSFCRYRYYCCWEIAFRRLQGHLLKVVAFLHIKVTAFDVAIVENIERIHGRIDTVGAAED
jgi:hypothetical protein